MSKWKNMNFHSISHMTTQDERSLRWTSCTASNTGLLLFFCWSWKSLSTILPPGPTKSSSVKGNEREWQLFSARQGNRRKDTHWGFMRAKGKQKSQSQSCFTSHVQIMLQFHCLLSPTPRRCQELLVIFCTQTHTAFPGTNGMTLYIEIYTH